MAVTLGRFFDRRYVDVIDSEVNVQREPIYKDLFQKALEERKEYEKFYCSTEWQILRKSFLSSSGWERRRRCI